MSRETLTTFLFELANFVALAAVLVWLFFKPVRKAIADQSAKVKSFETEAAAKLAETEAMRNEISAERASLAVELEQQRKNVLDQAKGKAANLLADARKQAEHEREKLRDDAVNIQRVQFAKIADAIAKSTRQTVGRLLQQLTGAELDDMLMTAACNELANASFDHEGPVTIESAAELTAETKNRLEAVLKGLNGKVNFRVAPELQAGVRISTPSGLVDASVLGLSNFAEQELAAEIEDSLRDASNSDGQAD